MPNPNPCHRTRFKPGQSGNPSGRPKAKFPTRLKSFVKRALRAGGSDVYIARELLLLAASLDPNIRLEIGTK